MAAGLKPLALALLAALALHLLGLAGIAAQMKTSASLLQERKDPLFTRTISAASEPVAAPAPPAVPAPAVRASTGARNLPAQLWPQPSQSDATVTQADPRLTQTAMPEPSVTTPTSTHADSEPPVVVTTTIAQATPVATPTQSQSNVPSSATDSLLVTGSWPADTRLSYRLTGQFRGELHGSGQVQWTRSGEHLERYQVRVTIDVGPEVRVLTSQGLITPHGLQPSVYEESRKLLFGAPKIRSLQLLESELVLENGRRIPKPAAHAHEIQDAVSQFIDLGHRFNSGRSQLKAGQPVRVWLARPGGLNEWVFDVSEAQSMDVPRIGEVMVHHLKPRPVTNPRGNITFEIWLAPSLQHLPVRIRLNVDAQTYVDLFAERIEQR